jgi:hypothetical protein
MFEDDINRRLTSLEKSVETLRVLVAAICESGDRQNVA